MSERLRFLLVEDSSNDIRIFDDTINRMNDQNKDRVITYEVATTVEMAQSKLNDNYIGVIIDIKLEDSDGGNLVIEYIMQHFRKPVAIMTGTPDTVVEEGSPINIYKKGEASYEEIINDLVKIYNTGISNVIGDDGIIEEALNNIFWKNLYPQIHIWKERKEFGDETNKALLRYAISHLQELLDEEIPFYFTEEMFIKPPVTINIKTGSIVKNKTSEKYFIILSPPCDLAVHDGKIKTDRILLCEIDDHGIVSRNAIGAASIAKRAKILKEAIKNNLTDYYHWLPSNSLFTGGYINFRKVITYTDSQLNDEFHNSEIKIQDYFVKDILGRFSMFYARQGQPDFDFDEVAATILTDLYNE